MQVTQQAVIREMDTDELREYIRDKQRRLHQYSMSNNQSAYSVTLSLIMYARIQLAQLKQLTDKN